MYFKLKVKNYPWSRSHACMETKYAKTITDFLAKPITIIPRIILLNGYAFEYGLVNEAM
jgi:hypothetical protein